jgi:dolichol-phosphate mannosyltransferase
MALVSILIPVYYNAASLQPLHQRLAAVARENSHHTFEFIFVDDGSGDNSYEVMLQLAGDDRVRLFVCADLATNAILAGMTYASGDCVAFIAADLQDPPELLTEMLRRWETGNKIVLAMRRDRSGDPWLTRMFATSFNWLFQKFVFQGNSPQGIGFFLIDRQIVNLLLNSNEKNPFMPGLLLWVGFRPSLIDYDRAKREHGNSRWTVSKKIKYFIDAFAAFSYLPLRICSLIGILLAIVGGIYALVIFISRLLNQIPVPGWTTLTIIVLLTSAFQLIMLGVIGEYIWRTLDAARNRPQFIVDETINVRKVDFE